MIPTLFSCCKDHTSIYSEAQFPYLSTGDEHIYLVKLVSGLSKAILESIEDSD